MSNYVKMSVETFNKIGEALNKLEIRQGIQNAITVVQMFELLKNSEIIEVKEEEVK